MPKINWPKELEEKLATDERLTQSKSRFSDASAFFYEGKELAHFHAGGIDIRLGAAGIFALQAKLVRESVLTVTKDWVLLRVESEEELNFAYAVLERAMRESTNANARPTGKKTRRVAGPQKSKAMKAFGDAKALRDLEELDPRAKK